MNQNRGNLSGEAMESARGKMEAFREKVRPVLDLLHKATKENGVGFVADFCLGRFGGGLVTTATGNVIGVVGDDFPVHYVIFTLLSRQKMTLEELAKAIVEDRLAEALIEWGGGSMVDIEAIRERLDNFSGGDPDLN